MDNHVASLCRSCFVQLRQLRTIRSMLTKETTIYVDTRVYKTISSRLDYCNSVLYGISSTLLRRLQSTQNAAARLVTGTKKFDHITPVLRELHWLPIRQRIAHTLSLLVYKCLHNACTSLPEQRLCTGIIVGRETTTAFLCQWHTGQSADKNCSWSSRVQSVRPCDVEHSSDRTAYC